MICAHCLRSIPAPADGCVACDSDGLLQGRYRIDSGCSEPVPATARFHGHDVVDGVPVWLEVLHLTGVGQARRAAVADALATLEAMSVSGLAQEEPHLDTNDPAPRLWRVAARPSTTTLARRLSDDGPLSWSDARFVVHSLAGVLAALHTSAVPRAHLGISTRTVALDAHGSPLLGLSQWPGTMLAAGFGRSWPVPVSLGGGAPELALGPATPSADVFALGTLLVELLSGMSPDALRDADGSVLWRQAVDPASEAGALLPRLLHPDPNERLPDALAVLQVLDALPPVSAGVVVVDPAGGGHYTELLDALNEAGPATRIVLRPGNYTVAPQLTARQTLLGHLWRPHDVTIELSADESVVLDGSVGLAGVRVLSPAGDAVKVVDGAPRLTRVTVDAGNGTALAVLDGTPRLEGGKLSGAQGVVVRAETLCLQSVAVEGTAPLQVHRGAVSALGVTLTARPDSAAVAAVASGAALHVRGSVLGPGGAVGVQADEGATVRIVDSVVEGVDVGLDIPAGAELELPGSGVRFSERAFGEARSPSWWPRRVDGKWTGPGLLPLSDGGNVATGSSSAEMARSAEVRGRHTGQLRTPVPRSAAQTIAARALAELHPPESLSGADVDWSTVSVLEGAYLHAWRVAGPASAASSPWLPERGDTPESFDDDAILVWSDNHSVALWMPRQLMAWMRAMSADLPHVRRLGLHDGLHGPGTHPTDGSKSWGMLYGRMMGTGAWHEGADPNGYEGPLLPDHPLRQAAACIAHHHAIDVQQLESQTFLWLRCRLPVADRPPVEFDLAVGAKPCIVGGTAPSAAVALAHLLRARAHYNNDANLFPVEESIVRALHDHPVVTPPVDDVLALMREVGGAYGELEGIVESLDDLKAALVRPKRGDVKHLGDHGVRWSAVRNAVVQGSARRSANKATNKALDQSMRARVMSLGLAVAFAVVVAFVVASLPEAKPVPEPEQTPTITAVRAPSCGPGTDWSLGATVDGDAQVAVVLAETAAKHPTRDGWFEYHLAPAGTSAERRFALSHVKHPDEVSSGYTLFPCDDRMPPRLTYEMMVYTTDDAGEILVHDCVTWGHSPGFSGTHQVTGVTVTGAGCRTIEPGL